jgi:hypothetical protein
MMTDDGRLDRVVIGPHARDVGTTGNTDSALSGPQKSMGVVATSPLFNELWEWQGRRFAVGKQVWARRVAFAPFPLIRLEKQIPPKSRSV